MTPWAIAWQAPLSMEFSRQEYWSGLPFTPPGDLPDPGIHSISSVFPALPGGTVVKSLPAVQEIKETRVLSLGREDTLEE